MCLIKCHCGLFDVLERDFSFSTLAGCPRFGYEPLWVGSLVECMRVLAVYVVGLASDVLFVNESLF